MKTYLYKAINKAGVSVEGDRTAESKEILSTELTQEGLSVVFIEETKKVGWAQNLQFSIGGSVKDQDKIVFSRNLGKMISAGLSLVRALEIIEKQQKKGKFKDILVELKEEVSKGKTLAEAMKMHSNVFESLMVAMVRAGEESGNLSESLLVVSDQMEKVATLKKKIKGAMIYPGVILSAMLVISILMLIFVVPTLSSTFSGLDLDLPLTTRILIGMSDFMQNHMILALSSIVAVILSVGAFLRSAIGKKFMDSITLKIPVIKNITKEINSARTARTLSSLLKSGVTFTTAISITEEVLQNSHYKKALVEAQEFVLKGGNISDIFARHSHIYPLYVSEMTAVGEETGNISDMLLEVALYYEEEVQRKTKDMSTVIEPFLMILIGAGVGFFALSMVSPMYSLADHI
jgi:type IV pilus assembly protein PilC